MIAFYYYRDAWKNIEGMGEMEAKHRYVETLLRVATEVPLIIYNISRRLTYRIGLQETCGQGSGTPNHTVICNHAALR
jgi:hypothetical protein